MATAGFRTLLHLAWPIVLARSAQSVISFSDAAMVAPLGDDALAATTTGAINTVGLIVFPVGTVLIIQSFSSQLTGAEDHVGARRYLGYGLVIAGLSALLGLLALPLLDPALALTGHTPAVRAAMSEYMSIRLLSIGLAVAMEAFGAWFGGLGNTRVAMRASITAMLLNIVFNWILIYGELGAPALGIRGAAWASVLASAGGLAIAAIAFARHPRPQAPANESRLRLRELLRMLRFGLPSGLTWFLEFAALLAFINFIVAELGTVAVAALMAVVAVNSVSFMPAFGLSSAGAVLVGQAIGADRRDEVPSIVLRTFVAVATWQSLVGLLYLLVPGPLMAIFARDDLATTNEVVVLGTTLLAISAAWQILDATVMSVSEALRAAGDTDWILWARILLAWFLWLPIAFAAVFVAETGAIGALWSMVVYFVALSLAVVFRFRGGAWRSIDLTGKTLTT